MNQLISLFAIVLLQAVINVLALLPYPVLLCLFHAFLDFLVKCSVLGHSISIFLILFVFEFSPFGTQIKDVSCDPGLVDWAVFAEDLIGCVSNCCTEGGRQHVHVHVRV